MNELKEFEKKQLEWWCNHYRIILKDLTKRSRQYMNGEIAPGILDAFLSTLENQQEERMKLV